MILYSRKIRSRLLVVTVWIAAGLIISGPGIALSHGGNTHGDELFSAFQAVQKAATLYDRLIVSSKLSEEWETNLTSIHVDTRGAENNREYVVQFKRTGGDTESVYFYFDRQGEYTGSNFTGK